MSSCEVPNTVVRFYLNWNFLARFYKKKKIKNQISGKFVQWMASCSMRTHRLDEAKSLFTILRIRLRSRQASINFDILLTAHLSIILAINQPIAQILLL